MTVLPARSPQGKDPPLTRFLVGLGFGGAGIDAIPQETESGEQDDRERKDVRAAAYRFLGAVTLQRGLEERDARTGGEVGAAPVTRASGRSRVVVAQAVKNQGLASAGYMRAFAALRSHEPREHYDSRRSTGERHTAALRNLFNKLLGCLYHSLQNHMPYDPERAFATPVALAA